MVRLECLLNFPIFNNQNISRYDTLYFMNFQLFPTTKTVGLRTVSFVEGHMFFLCISWFCLFIFLIFQGENRLCFGRFLLIKFLYLLLLQKFPLYLCNLQHTKFDIFKLSSIFCPICYFVITKIK